MRGALVALLVAWAGAAWAEVRPPRWSEHEGFTRLSVELPPGVVAAEAREGDVLVLRLAGAGRVAGMARALRHVREVRGGTDQLRLVLPAGGQVRLAQAGRVLTVEAAGPAKPMPAPAKRVPAPARPMPAPVDLSPPKVSLAEAPLVALPRVVLVPDPPPGPLRPREAPARAAQAEPPRPAGAPEQAVPPQGGGERLAVSRPADEADSIVLPFAAGTGAAAFTRGRRAFLVFDEARPADLAPLRDDGLFGQARVEVLPAATLVTLPLPPGREPALTRVPEGWRLRLAPPPPEGADWANLSLKDGGLTIGVAHPGASLIVPDPDTGGRLLVGTVLAAGPAPDTAHQAPEFTLLPSALGVVVAAGADRLALRPARQGFRLSADGGLAASMGGAEALAAGLGGGLTRRFALPALPVPVLRARLLDSLQAAARAPRLARFEARLRAAQDMLALGLAREAARLAAVAVADDPARQAGSVAPLLQAVAAGLAGEPAPAVPPEPDGAPATDEARFWRALLQPDAPGRAATLAATWRLPLAYPAPLRDRVLPKLTEALVASGLLAQAQALLDQGTAPALALPRAELALRQGKQDAALAQFDALAAGADRRVAAAAARQAVEARLAAGQLTPAAAAAALSHHLYSWREPDAERALRLRVAALRAQGGDWRRALSLLRETDALFPEAHSEVAAAEREVIGALLRAGAGSALSPIDLVALAEENADLLSEREASTVLAPVLVDKLLALDLPERAETLLRRLLAQAPAGEGRARLGLRLAGLVLDRGDAGGTLAVLEGSAAPGVPEALSAERDLVRARALAASGRAADGLAVLAGRGDGAALRLTAELAERAGDFARAESALAAVVAGDVGPAGMLTPAQQTLVLRLASAAARAGDGPALARLRGLAPRLPQGPAAAMLQALAQAPVRRLADLPRSAAEAVSLRELPAALAAFPAP